MNPSRTSAENAAERDALVFAALDGPFAGLLDQGLPRALIESLPGLFFVFNSAQRMVAWNGNFALITGYDQDQLGRMTVSDWFEPDVLPLALETVERLMESGETSTLEVPLLLADGGTHPFLFSGRRFFFEGQPYFAGLGIDIADRRAYEERVRHGQKMEAIGSLAGGIAHDFNNLLVPILLNAELTRESVADRPELCRYLEDIVTAAEHAKGLVANILSFGRQHSRGVTTFDLRAPVRDVARLLETSADRRIVVERSLPDVPVPVTADPSEVRQVVLNLCTNGLQAMAACGGTLRVELATVRSERPSGAPAVALTVSDEGVGIPADVRHRIFDPFFTTKPIGEGTGLGLSVVHGIVVGLDGEISVESEPGCGTSVRVLLPLAGGAVATAAIQGAVELVRGDGERILIVDDEPLVARSLQHQLTKLGYQVDAFIDSSAAVRMLRADPEYYDVLLTDFKMPGLDGAGVATAARAAAPDLPIVMLSGFADGLKLEEIAALEVRFLAKPPAMGALTALLRAALERA